MTTIWTDRDQAEREICAANAQILVLERGMRQGNLAFIDKHFPLKVGDFVHLRVGELLYNCQITKLAVYQFFYERQDELAPTVAIKITADVYDANGEPVRKFVGGIERIAYYSETMGDWVILGQFRGDSYYKEPFTGGNPIKRQNKNKEQA